MNFKDKSWFRIFDTIFIVNSQKALELPVTNLDVALPIFFNKLKEEDLEQYNNISKLLGD